MASGRPSDRAFSGPAGRSIGTLLREFRRSRLLTQNDLAERAQVSVRTIRHLESGRVAHPRPHTLARLTGSLALRPSEQMLLERVAGREAGPSNPSPEPPSTLPPSNPDFCGREAEVAHVAAALLAPPPNSGALVACAVAGQPGVGKTALALRVAHQLRAEGRFPDGQLYADLQGASTSPADPSEVVGRFLVALGIDAAALPESLDDRVDRYRTILDDRQVLVVLDSAAGEAQVRPLLPGAGSSAVLITSRNRLSGLEGAQPVDLGVLDDDAAVRLLSTIIGHRRVAGEPDAARAVVRYCHGLPLALRIVGARLAARPDRTLAGLAGRLEDERNRLDELAAGDLAVRTSFALSYGALPPAGRRLFRRLALAGNLDVPGWVAAPLADVSPGQGLRLMEELQDAHLLEAAGQDALGQDRYRFHDLLRLYARELLDAEPPADRLAAVRRLAGSWLALADVAAAATPAGTLTLVHGDAPRYPPHRSVRDLVLADPLGWLDVEHPALVTVVTQAAAAGLDDAAWDLSGCLSVFFAVHTHFDAWRRSQEAGLAAARRAGQPVAEAHLLRGLGHLRSEQDRLDLATESFERALEIFVARGERRGEASTLDDLGVVYHLNGRTDQALRCLDRAESIFVADDDPVGLAQVRFSQGIVRLDQGDHAEAEAKLLDARRLLAAAADRYTESQILRKLAQLYRTTDRYDQAAAVLEESLELDRRLDDRLGEALTVQALGEVRRRQERTPEASALLEAALGEFRAVGYQYGEALALRSLGELRLGEAEPHRAIAALRESLVIWQDLGRPRNEAHTLASLGNAYAALGDLDEATLLRGRALTLYRQLGAPEAEALGALLA